MNDHAYPTDWAKPKFFFGQKVSLKCLPDSSLWWGLIQGMRYSNLSNLWTYEVLINPCSYLLENTEPPELYIVWLEPNMVLAD